MQVFQSFKSALLAGLILAVSVPAEAVSAYWMPTARQLKQALRRLVWLSPTDETATR